MGLNFSPKIVTDGLILYLDAGNTKSYSGSGTTWTDLSRFNLNGTLTNGPTFSTTNGGSIVFDGTNDFVNITTVPPLNNVSQFSYSSFLKFNSRSPNGNAFFSYGQSLVYTTDILFAWDLASNKLFFQVNNGSDGTAYYPFSPGPWINLCVVYNGNLTGNINRLKVYINSIQVTLDFNTYTVPATTANPSSVKCYIGEYVGSPQWSLNGSIVTTSLYNRALSDTEISQNYNTLKGRFGL